MEGFFQFIDVFELEYSAFLKILLKIVEPKLFVPIKSQGMKLVDGQPVIELFTFRQLFKVFTLLHYNVIAFLNVVYLAVEFIHLLFRLIDFLFIIISKLLIF